MKIKVISDGTATGTRLINENGEMIERVSKVVITIDAEQEIVTADVKFILTETDIVADATFEETKVEGITIPTTAKDIFGYHRPLTIKNHENS